MKGHMLSIGLMGWFTEVPDYPAVADVIEDVYYADDTMRGTYKLPSQDEVAEGTVYGAEGEEVTGTYHHRHNIRLENVGIQLR